MEPFESHITQIKQALSEEVTARALFPKKSVLTNGTRVADAGEYAFYRFEVPESFLFEPLLNVRCTFGTKLRYSFSAVIADVHHQFVFFLVPLDLGETISEMTCEWNPSETMERLLKHYETVQPKEILTALFKRDFANNIHPTSKEPIFPSSFTDSQRDAVKKSIGRKISFIIGERSRGKTGVAASLLFSSLRAGKRVLYLTASSGSLYNCMKEIVSLNPVVAEESVAVFDSGIRLLPPLPMPVYSMKRDTVTTDADGLKKLIKIITAEYEYDRVDALMQKVHEKQRQIQETIREAEDIKAELMRLQNASMIERMKQRINKGDIDYVQSQFQNKIALVERLKQHAATLAKEQFKKETQLPVLLKEKKGIEHLASTQLSLQPSIPANLTSFRCIAATVYQALLMDREQLGEFDVVCIDDAHALNLAEFFWCASLAKEHCAILADITEQPPQSVSQLEPARKWLQKNYFTYFQHEDDDEHRFTIGLLPKETANELVNPALAPTLFESSLAAVLNETPIPEGAKGKIYFINTDDQRSISTQYLGKKKILPYNDANARRVIECVKHALMNGNTTQADILIVTPPSGQSMYLRELLKANQMSNIEIASFGSIRLCTKRSVIFDTTVAGLDFTLRLLDDKKYGAVRIADTFNTLLSTVREDFYVVADLAHFNIRYKDRFITKLLNLFSEHSENIANISNAARRVDDLSPELLKKVLFATAEEKQSADYKTKIERSKQPSTDAAKTAPQRSIAVAERSLKMEIRAAILRLLAKREIVNIIAQYLESYPLYRTTPETQKYCLMLAEMDCENENDFKNIMDMWNLLIYETSNAQKTNHPLAAKAKVDSKISSDIQQIYVYYHSDLEMVVEEGKHKLAQSIQKIFNDCIGKKPVTPSDWMNAYLVFLGRMEKYLDTVINQIRM